MLEQVETLSGKGKQAHACSWQESVARATVSLFTLGGRQQVSGWRS